MGNAATKQPGDQKLPSAPVVPPTPREALHRSWLLHVLFLAIDKDQRDFLDRESVLEFIQNAPFLRHPSVAEGTSAMLELLEHDEDSQMSEKEFFSAFKDFQYSNVKQLIISLIRDAPVKKPIPLTPVFGTSMRKFPRRHFEWGWETIDNDLVNLPPGVPKPEPLSSEAKMMRNKEKHDYLLEVLFNAIDLHNRGQLEVDEIDYWVDHDRVFHTQSLDSTTISSLLNELQDEKSQIVSKEAFFKCFDGISVEEVEELFVDILRRTTVDVAEKAHKLQVEKRLQSPPVLDGLSIHIDDADLISSGDSTDSALPRSTSFPQDLLRSTLPVTAHHSSRRRSPLSPGAVSSPPGDANETETLPPLQLQRSLSDSLLSPRSGDEPLPSPTELQADMDNLNLEEALSSPLASPPPPSGLSMCLTGQAMIQHDIRRFDQCRDLIDDLKKHLIGDVIFTELETAINGKYGGENQRNSIFYHAAPPEVLDVIKELNFNLLAASNNHAYDLGEPGLRSLMEALDDREFVWAGVGSNVDEASAPAFLYHDKGCVALVSFASKVPPQSIATRDRPGVSHLSMDDPVNRVLNEKEAQRILNSIRHARKEAEVVIAYHHNHYWEKAAVNQAGAMGAWKKAWARRCIDAGATMYVAHGDPRLQGIEIYRGCPIFYCLGSLIFQTKTELGFYGSEVWESVIIQIVHDRPGEYEAKEDVPRGSQFCPAQQFRTIKIIPVILSEDGVIPDSFLQTRGLPRQATGDVARDILDRLAEISEEHGTEILIEDEDDNNVVGWIQYSGV